MADTAEAVLQGQQPRAAVCAAPPPPPPPDLTVHVEEASLPEPSPPPEVKLSVVSERVALEVEAAVTAEISDSQDSPISSDSATPAAPGAAEVDASKSGTTPVRDDLDDRRASPRLAATARLRPPPPVTRNDVTRAGQEWMDAAGNLTFDQPPQDKMQLLHELQSQPAAPRANSAAIPAAQSTGAEPMKSLLRNGRLYFEDLCELPHGRHLLLVTLLEKVDRPLWEPRSQGRIQFYLPETLRSGLT